MVINKKKTVDATSSESVSSTNSSSGSSSSSDSSSSGSSSDSESSSSEVESSEESKSPAKPKEKLPNAASTVYSSETDDEEVTARGGRKLPAAKPKSSATVRPAARPAARPARKVAAPPPTLPTRRRRSTAKSIFSPDRPPTPPMPKLTPMKASPKTRSTSSASSDSEYSQKKVEPKKATVTKVKAPSVSVSATGTTRGRGRPRKNPPPRPAAARKKAEPKPKVENVQKIVTRKKPRCSPSKFCKLLSTIQDDGTDTDSDVEKLLGNSKSTGKKGRSKAGRGTKKRAASVERQHPALVELEERLCPVEGCDSTGHMNGYFERHFTVEACPLYHNMAFSECKKMYAERTERDKEPFEAKITKASPTAEQKAYRELVDDMRREMMPVVSSDGDADANGAEREHDLLGYSGVSVYDYKIFREAQAIASERFEDELQLLPKVRGIKYIEIGNHIVEVWYQSPYPEEYTRVPKLYICEFCLKYRKSREMFERHASKCIWRHPPGEEVYRKDKISVWEVDGKKYKIYSQNLCLLAKFFLDHKTLYWDVDPFLFYIMTVCDGDGCHLVGYFSKEKNSYLNFNVSCILTLPPYQRQGYGTLLIDFSYLLTKVEGKVGSPEKPLSDLGLISYRSYWKDIVLEKLCYLDGKQISIKDLSQELGINSYDIVSTLQALGMIKYWKGKHIILKKQDIIKDYLEKRSKRKYPVHRCVDPDCLKWHPPNSTQPNGNVS